MKMVVTNDLRLLSLDRFLTEPIESLTPDKKLYDLDSLADQRKFKQDCEEVLKQATHAWTIIRQRFKVGSAAESLIKPCDEEGAADILWKTFTTHYCNRTTRAGIMQIVERFFDDKTAVNSDILSYFTLYNDIFREIQSVPLLSNSAASLTGLSSPLRQRLPVAATPQKLADQFANSLASEASNPVTNPQVMSVSTFPQWAQVLFILFRIAQFPAHKKFIKDFLFEYVTKAIEKNVETMTTDECFTLLKAYTKIWSTKHGEAPIAVLHYYTEKAKLYCAFHGPDSSHDTKNCNAIHAKRIEEEREAGPRPPHHFTTYRGRNHSSRDRNYPSRESQYSSDRSRDRSPHRRESSRNSFSRSRDRSRNRDRSHSPGRYDRAPSPYQPANRSDRTPAPYSQAHIAQHNTEINSRTAARDPEWHSGIHGYASSELPPGFRSTPPQSDYDSNIDAEDNDDLGPPTEFNMINIYCNIVELESQEMVQQKVVLGDSACNGFLLNELNAHLAADKEECTGTVWGANGPMPGAITKKGFVSFMGVKIRCYIGKFSKGAAGQNWMAVHYGFEWRIKGHYCEIYSSRSGQTATVRHNPINCLTELSEELFGPVNVEMHLSVMNPTDVDTLMHFRLGHIHEAKYKFMKNQPLYTSRGIPSATQISKHTAKHYCDICASAKGHRVVSHKAVDKETAEVGLYWHADCPAQSETPALITGNKSRILFTDRKSRLAARMAMKDNTMPEVLKAAVLFHDQFLAPVKEWYRDTRQRVTIHIYADNGELAYSEVVQYFRSKAVFIHFTAPDHSSSNGLAEVRIKLVRQMSRSLMLTHSLPEEFFEKAENHAVYLLNRVPFIYQGKFQVDPYTLFTGKTADYSILRVFGSKVWVFTRTLKDSRPRSTQGIFVGYAPNSNTPVAYLPTENKFVPSGHISFIELAEDALGVQVVPDEQQWSEDAMTQRAVFLLSDMTLN